MILAASDGMSEQNKLHYAVIDSGATETVGSLDAVEAIMAARSEVFGQETVGIDPKRKKRFKFGNAQERFAESYLLLPQKCEDKPFSLGLYTLDVPMVPVLIGVKTMKRLGAVLDVGKTEIMFTKVFPGIRIPLIEGKNGHLLLDLCRDWTKNLIPSFHSPQGFTFIRTLSKKADLRNRLGQIRWISRSWKRPVMRHSIPQRFMAWMSRMTSMTRVQKPQ